MWSKNKLVHLPSNITEPQLQLLNALLNTSFTGKTLQEITPDLMQVAEKGGGQFLRADLPGGFLRHGGAGGAGDL